MHQHRIQKTYRLGIARSLDLWSSLLTLGILKARFRLLSLNRSLGLWSGLLTLGILKARFRLLSPTRCLSLIIR